MAGASIAYRNAEQATGGSAKLDIRTPGKSFHTEQRLNLSTARAIEAQDPFPLRLFPLRLSYVRTPD